MTESSEKGLGGRPERLLSSTDFAQSPNLTAAARAQCGRILQSRFLGERSRLPAMLSYIVEEELAGRGDRLKAYAIGTEVVGRGADFDPNNDSIVRVEANRLRQALELYQAAAGADDALRIELPKGGYRPKFYLREQDARAADSAQSAASDQTSSATGAGAGASDRMVRVQDVGAGAVNTVRSLWRRAPLAVAAATFALVFSVAALAIRFADRATEPTRPVGASLGGNVATGGALSPYITVQLATDGRSDAERAYLAVLRSLAARFRDFHIEIRPLSDLNTTPTAAAQNYILDLRIIVFPVSPVLHLSITHQRTGAVVWSESMLIEIADDPGAVERQFETFRRLAAPGLQPWGPVFAHYRSLETHTQHMRCEILRLSYIENQTDSLHAATRDCLEDLIAAGETDWRLFRSLAVMHREEHTDKRNLRRDPPPVPRALAAAKAASGRAPDSASAHYILTTVYAVMGNHDLMLATGERAIELNPYDASILAGFATRLNFRGQHERALELLSRAEQLQPFSADWRYYQHFLAGMGLGDTQRAIDAAIALSGTQQPIYLAAQAIGAKLAGDPKAASDLFQKLRAADPDFDANPSDMYRRRDYDPKLVATLMSELNAIKATSTR